MKRSLYLSERLDEDILEELDIENIPAGDFSLVVKKLMRDGIKWRERGDTIAKPTRKIVEAKESNVDFSDIKLQKKEVSIEELESKLDNL